MTTRPAPKTFAITGVGGVVAPRHLKAIAETGGEIMAAFDPNDSVGALDEHDLAVPFFTEEAAFVDHIEEALRDRGRRLDYLTVCSPNHVHEAQCRLGLGLGADVICEKPVVVDPRSIDALERLEQETGRRIWTVLQLRTHDRLAPLRETLLREGHARHEVVLTYVTSRGLWYDASWKGDVTKSGGISTNIGVHMFDLLLWLFGAPLSAGLHLHERRRMAGYLELERARVSWLLSVDAKDVPAAQLAKGQRALRTIAIDGSELDFSTGFSVLHTRVYERTLRGEGFGLADARPSIELAHRMRDAVVESPTHLLHPLLGR